MPLIKASAGESLLMEVRSLSVKQPGEMCFPGGRIENDELPTETAIRETCEELGVRAEDIDIISDPELEIMDDGRKVWSILARIEADALTRLTLSDNEVAEVFLLPVSWLNDNPPAYYDLGSTPDAMLPHKLLEYLSHYQGFRRKGGTFYWEYEGHGIWGLTARILMKYRRAHRGLQEGNNASVSYK